ncbi:hypothetical protein H7J74_19635 [Mycobacterium angelicum]|nr:hypothetical protein [Mycobacterium angelicum]
MPTPDPAASAVKNAVKNVLVWHVHGSWTQALVAGRHRYLIPVAADHGADGLGLAGRSWPNAREVALEDLRHCDIDVVVLQRPREAALLGPVCGSPGGSGSSRGVRRAQRAAPACRAQPPSAGRPR